jgi:DNA-binding transcriptional MerR regulator
MRVGEVARRTGVTVRALRYYESIGLVVPSRLPNGYRDHDPVSVRQVKEIRALTGLGLPVHDARPFVECLASGHDAGDECPASLATYRRTIDRLSAAIAQLVSSQPKAYQRELVGRPRLPFAMLSGQDLAVRDALGVPVFAAAGMTLYRRLTLIVSGGVIE